MNYSLCSIISQVIDVIRALIPTLEALAVLLFMFSGFQYVRHTVEGRQHTDRTGMAWGLLALFILASLWGILGLVKSQFFPNDPSHPGSGACGVQATTIQAGTQQKTADTTTSSQTKTPDTTVAPVTFPAR